MGEEGKEGVSEKEKERQRTREFAEEMKLWKEEQALAKAEKRKVRWAKPIRGPRQPCAPKPSKPTDEFEEYEEIDININDGDDSDSDN